MSLSVGANNASTTFSGALSGSGGLTVVGNGAITLSGSSNSYTGGTTISAGALVRDHQRDPRHWDSYDRHGRRPLVATPVYNANVPVSSWLSPAATSLPNPSGAIVLPQRHETTRKPFSGTSSGLFRWAATRFGHGRRHAHDARGDGLLLGGGGGTLYFTSNVSGSQSLAVGNQGIAGGTVVLTRLEQHIAGNTTVKLRDPADSRAGNCRRQTPMWAPTGLRPYCSRAEPVRCRRPGPCTWDTTPAATERTT